MASTASFAAVGVGVGGMDADHATAASYSNSAPSQAHPSSHNNSQNNNARANDEPTADADDNKKNPVDGNVNSSRTTFDSHRQNHNSSKLPAFRFADLKKDTIALPTLMQHIPPSPVSPLPDTTTNHSSDNKNQHQHQQHQQPQPQHQSRDAHDQQIPGSQSDNPYSTGAQIRPDKTCSPETTQLNPPRSRDPSPPKPTRASTFQPSTSTTKAKPDIAIGTKRPASFSDAPRVITIAQPSRTQSSSTTTTTTPTTKRRLTASSVAFGASSLQRSATSSTDGGDDSTTEWAQGQRDLLLPKSLDSTKADDRKKSRPPVSYRPPAGARIPPIRGFRSSGSRKSLNLDAHVRRMSQESSGEDSTDPTQRDRTLRALEGREDDDLSRITPPDSGNAMNDGDGDNTADLFMRIAREDTNQRQDERERPADQGAISRITRGAHRRPLSTNVPTFQAQPPPMKRRLSDQRETSRAHPGVENQPAQQIPRELSYRSSVRERPTSNTAVVDDSARLQARPTLRPSPITPRQINFQEPTFQEPAIEVSSTYRRRQSVAESNVGPSAGRTYRNQNLSLGQSRMYNSSPLVPKTVDVQRNEPLQSIENHGVEGTESSASGGPAPSTVWDELDDLKSRMRRLELTGKAPSTSGAAMSRASDDRPPTATTNATTMSASPKRGTGANATQPDAASTTSSHKEPQPLLLSALTKTKGLVGAEAYDAMESAANDALALSAMMGTPGQPGPISSSTSTIGGLGGITDRQLRRKADSICRSLTELYIALADEMSQLKGPQSAHGNREMERELMASPTLKVPASQRRPSALVDTTATKPILLSPRAPTSLEQRRLSMLASTTALPSPRFAMAPAPAPAAPMEPTGAGRKTSLLLARTRRAGTEEPEEATAGRKSSLLLRTRRAGTEEPEDNREGRKTSHMLRTRKTTDDSEDESRFRVPSRAITEVNVFRAGITPAAVPGAPQDSNPLGSSALPRRRLIPSSLNSRLVSAAQSMTPTRRYLDRPVLERETNTNNSTPEKPAEERATRQFSLSQTAMLNRTSSINRRPRDSGLPNSSSQNVAAGGSYR